MKKRNLVLATVFAIAAGGAAVVYKWGDWAPQSAVAQSSKAGSKKGGGAPVPVDVATSVKKTMPVRVDLLGNVTPIASVAVKTRVDSEITQVHFKDGAIVKQGDLLFTLDGRAIEAQIKQTEGLLSAAKAQLEQNLRDAERYTDLAAKNATTLVTLNNAKTAVNIFRGTVDSQTAQLELLRVQLDYTVIRAQISGRVSMAAVKVGNFASGRSRAACNHHSGCSRLCDVPAPAAQSSGFAQGPRRKDGQGQGDHSGRFPVGGGRSHDDRKYGGRDYRHSSRSRHDAKCR